MELKICLKKLFRTPIKTFLFFLLLTVTGALLSLCVSLLISARDTNKKAQETFTTIAIPNFEKIKYDAIDHSKDLNDLKEKDFIESVESINRLYYKVLDQASETKIGKVDLRKSYLAFSKDLIPVLIPGSEREVWNEWSLCYNMAVFELECVGIETIKYDSNLKKRNPAIEDIKIVNWKIINNILALHPSYKVFGYVQTYTTESEMNTMGLFEIGKKYLMAGYTKNFVAVVGGIRDSGGKYYDRIAFFKENSFKNVSFDKNLKFVPNQRCEGYFNSYVELKEDARTFLASDEGDDFKRLIENCQTINRSVNVIGIDNINAVPHFNQKKAFIVNGREITAEEYRKGENVCIVSWQFANLNNLNVGDEIDLSLSDAKYEYFLSSSIKNSPLNRTPNVAAFSNPNSSIEGEALWFLNINPYSMPKSKDQSFKIVGIYQAPKVEVVEFMLSPNAIFTPSKAVDLSEIKQDNSKIENFNQIPTSLYSIIIPNDELEEFKEELKQTGIDKYFLYYDQGYFAVKSVLKILSQNALIILSVGLVIWILVLILFILLYIIKEKKLAGIMLSLGVGFRRTFVHLIISCMLLALPSTILGGIISNALEDKVVSFSYNMAIDQVMKSSFDKSFSINADSSYNVLNEKDDDGNENQDQNSIISLKSNGFVFVMQLLQFLIIVCLSSVFIYFMLRKNPMELVKSKE